MVLVSEMSAAMVTKNEYLDGYEINETGRNYFSIQYTSTIFPFIVPAFFMASNPVSVSLPPCNIKYCI
ncbi:hypothetical protein [Reichenbachiella sp. MALMAid0571]|uniref:hypothetical protein n=1 Tax=Reichenbachiella sp. MALMAid0571 TaxID=3143939 RepID=UPI0032DEF4C0